MAESYDVFGSCILLREIFQDDLGRLYRAGIIKGESIDRNIWLRVLDGSGLSGDEIAASFEQARIVGETLTGAQLPKNPLFLEAGGVAALGCDYIAGQPLNRVLARARDEAFPLQPDNTLLIIEKLALALVAGEVVKLSGKVLAHGFLHPGLIYLSNDGEVTVTGFGVGDALLGALDDPEAVPGGRAYLAPEVLADRRSSQEGDVYSLGAILFHLLTGTALPVAPDDRAAALQAAHVAWDGEALAPDIRSILSRALAPAPGERFSTASDFRTELDKLIYGGAYSPTTFNLALFADRLFRSEIEEDEVAMQNESEIDIGPYVASEHEEPEPASGVIAGEPEVVALEPEATPPAPGLIGKRGLWYAVGGVAIVAIAAGIFWIGRGLGPQQPPPTPTPTPDEIAARRQAQEDRLRTLTQKMVQEMMAEREEEIRQELIARQTRIEELQRSLQRSERRAARSAAAAATEAATQKELMQEIQKQEEAQRVQQDALETERREAMEATSEPSPVEEAVVGAAVAASDANPSAEDSTDARKTEKTPPPMAPSPTSPPQPKSGAAAASVRFGDFVSPEEADTLPVVVKSQPLTWPRNAQRSKGKGVVVVRQTVNAGGGIDEVVVLRADHTGWGIPEAALEAAKGYRYKPGTKNGIAIATHTFVTWRYDFTQQP